MTLKLAPFMTVDLEISTARSEKRLTIHMADRGIRTRPAGPVAGYTSVSTRKAMQNPANEGRFNMYKGASAHVSLDSQHVSGHALDAAYSTTDIKLFNAKVPIEWRKRIDANPNAIYDYAEEVAAHYNVPLNRPLYPQIPGERNHFVLVPGKTVRALSPLELRRYSKALKV